MKKIALIIVSGLVLISVLIGCFLLYNNKKDEGDTNMPSDSVEEKKLYIKIDDRTLAATLEDNSSSSAFVQKLAQGDVTIDMHDYGDFEKVGPLDFDLPRNDRQITTTAGDIILYQGNSITIYYDTNSWNFTKLGHIDNATQEELKEILGDGNVTVTFSLEK